MKTTIDIPESLYTTLAAASSAEGLTLEDYILRAAKERTVGVEIATPKVDLALKKRRLTEFFAYLDGQSEEEKKATREAVADVQAIIDEEFSRIDPRDWE